MKATQSINKFMKIFALNGHNCFAESGPMPINERFFWIVWNILSFGNFDFGFSPLEFSIAPILSLPNLNKPTRISRICKVIQTNMYILYIERMGHVFRASEFKIYENFCKVETYKTPSFCVLSKKFPSFLASYYFNYMWNENRRKSELSREVGSAPSVWFQIYTPTFTHHFCSWRE